MRDGSLRDAILCSVGANAEHGVRRSIADRRRAITMVLQDPEWAAWSNSEIARRCAVSDKTVAVVRDALTSEIRSEPTQRTYQDRHGNVSQMETARIGRRQAEQPEPKSAPPVPDALADALARKFRQEAVQVRGPLELRSALAVPLHQHG